MLYVPMLKADGIADASRRLQAPAEPPPLFPAGAGAGAGSSRRRMSGWKVAGLLVLLAGTTGGGVLIGRAIEPTAVEVQVLTVTAKHPAAPKATPPRQPTKWGPLRAVPAGRLPAGEGVAAALMLGNRLVVVGAGPNRAVYAGPPGGALTRVARLPGAVSLAAAFAAGGKALVVGGAHGSKPTDAILRVDLAAKSVSAAGRFAEPLAEAGAVAQPGSGSVYLVGGWTGEKYATAVLRFALPDQLKLVARLPDGLRSPAVALRGSLIYVAGGRTQSGLSRSVYSVDTATGAVKLVGKLPQPVDRAVLVASGPSLYLLGGRSVGGKPLDTIVRIDPKTGRTARAGRMPNPLAGAATVPFGKQTLLVGASSGVLYRLG